MPLEPLRYGTWVTDDAGLPAFDLHVADNEAPDAPFTHLIASGHLSALADRWGNINLFTTDGGLRWLNPKGDARARSSLYLVLGAGEANSEPVSLLHSELVIKPKIRLGTGYVTYYGATKVGRSPLLVTQEYFMAPDRQCRLHVRFTLTNNSAKTMHLTPQVRADVNGDFPREEVFLTAEGEGWQRADHRHTLILTKSVRLLSKETLVINAATGLHPAGTGDFLVPADIRAAWAEKLAPFAVPEAPAGWMRRECLWNAGQLLSFTSYDATTKEYYMALGGYGWAEFGVREVAETSMVLAAGDWTLAAAALRFVAKTQLYSGDVPKMHTMRRDRPQREFESDNELWFVLGATESLLTRNTNLRDAATDPLLDEVCAFWDKGEAPLWEHLRRAFYWVKDGIGRGTHGLILIKEGDWNDYLSLIGAEGRGESVMNSGLACRAFNALATFAEERGEHDFAREVYIFTDKLRISVNAVFDRSWFIRGYTDNGQAVGSFAEDRLFINAQSWTVLGGCGTAEQRRAALQNAVAKCHTNCGLTLMSRPYSSPAPADISWCAIPAGEGENAGIWPQTIYWLVWALAETGLLEEALAEWQCGTLHNHAKHFPAVPYGIFNGPDCFSSIHAGLREGWTQTQLVDRARTVPMNPMVAWQGFAMRKILAAG